MQILQIDLEQNDKLSCYVKYRPVFTVTELMVWNLMLMFYTYYMQLDIFWNLVMLFTHMLSEYINSTLNADLETDIYKLFSIQYYVFGYPHNYCNYRRSIQLSLYWAFTQNWGMCGF